MPLVRPIVLAGLFAAAASPVFAQAPPAPAVPAVPALQASGSGSLVVLKAARMFDGRSDRIVDNAMVVIEGSKIREAGAGITPPPGAIVIELGDVTLLPGFIDAHTHMSGEASDNWLNDFYQGLRRSIPEQTLLASTYARKTLVAGFTTVRNVGAEDDIASMPCPLPKVFESSKYISPAGIVMDGATVTIPEELVKKNVTTTGERV